MRESLCIGLSRIFIVYLLIFRMADIKTKNPGNQFLDSQLGYKDSNLENDGVRVRCLTIWR